MKERRLLHRVAQPDSLTILNFHEIRESRGSYEGQLTPEQFDQLLGFIGTHFAVTTFAELGEHRNAERPLAILSFDDGFKSFVEYAMPILERHRMRANQNVIPSAVLGKRPFTVELSDLLAATSDARLRNLRIPGLTQSYTGGHDGRVRFSAAVSNHLKLRPRAERRALWQEVLDQLRGVEVRPTDMMNLDDVRLAARTHEIGAHSYEHETMPFESFAYFQDDFERCRRFFTTTLGAAPAVYAFPNGMATQHHVDWLRSQGVRSVLLVGDRYSTRTAHVHHRFNIAGTSHRELRLRALGWSAAGLL